MTTMLEKMALAIYRQAWGTAADKRWHDDVQGRAHFTEQARAALMAMREPSDPMWEAYRAAQADHQSATEIWEAMIDAILDEGR